MARKRTNVSHLIFTQAGRFVGVSQAAVTQRNQKKPDDLPAFDVFGVKMVRTDDCRRWIREIRKAERAKRVQA